MTGFSKIKLRFITAWLLLAPFHAPSCIILVVSIFRNACLDRFPSLILVHKYAVITGEAASGWNAPPPACDSRTRHSKRTSDNPRDGFLSGSTRASRRFKPRSPGRPEPETRRFTRFDLLFNTQMIV